MRKAFVVLALVGLAVGATMASPREAAAQTPPPMAPTGTITAVPQGAIGLGLLGAEAVVLIQGACGLRLRWAYAVFPAIGLVGGAVGGVFMDLAIDRADPPGSGPYLVSTGLLVGGLALIIPSIIMYLHATRYRPEDTAAQTDDNATVNVQMEESTNTPGRPGAGGAGGTGGTGGTPGAGGGAGGGRQGRRGHTHLPSDAFVNFAPGEFGFSMPAVTMVRSYSLREMQQYGIGNQTEWRVPVMSMAF
jgi:hypothetical protein